MILISDFQYFPPVTLIKKAIEFSNVKFDVYEDHRKMSFRNRCVLAGSGGRVNLSIPLSEGRNQKKALKEVRIDNKTGWQDQHWKTIYSCYNRSPWFEFYKFDLEVLFRQPVELLVDWNRLCWNWVMGKLDAGIATSYTDGYIADYDSQEFLDWRSKLMPRSIDSDFTEPVQYRQVFQDRTGFIPNLSILDLMFCEGRRSVEILKLGKIPN